MHIPQIQALFLDALNLNRHPSEQGQDQNQTRHNFEFS
jgi:hypothetical protein